MNASETVKNELKALLEMQKNLTALVRDKKDFIAFGTTYQHWYSRAYKLVESLAMIRILNQLQILASLSSRIDSVLQDVTGHLFAELQDAELVAATQLKKISRRAAGALAGVVLERHLQSAAKNHNILIGKKLPTISDLNDPLKNKGVYGTPAWRKIQLLADIRNLCSHQKTTEPTDEQVEELIAGVNSVIKSVF